MLTPEPENLNTPPAKVCPEYYFHPLRGEGWDEGWNAYTQQSTQKPAHGCAVSFVNFAPEIQALSLFCTSATANIKKHILRAKYHEGEIS